MRFIKKIVSNFHILLSMFLIFIFTGCSNNNEESAKKFKVGMECSYAPFNWIQPSNKGNAVKISGDWYVCGYDVYIAQRIAEYLGKELEIIKIDWDGLLPALTSGKIDAIIAAMSPTENRRRSIDFTEEYYTSNVVVVLKKGNKYEKSKTINDFKGAKVTAQLGTLQYNLIDQMDGADKQVAMDDYPSIISSLNSGKIDCYVSEKPAAMTTVHMNPSLTYIEFENGKGFDFSSDETQIAIGVNKGNILRNQINDALKTISNSTREELMSKAVEVSCNS